MTHFWYDNLLVHPWLPEGRSGDWSVRRNPIIGDRAEWLRLNGPNASDRSLSYPAVYTELWQNDDLWMMDRPVELLTAESFAEKASGNILILGLGLGIVPNWLAMKPSVKRIDIIECCDHVLSLVAAPLKAQSPKINIIKGDAETYQPTRHYDHLWADIWLKPDEQKARSLTGRYSSHCKEISFWLG